jgi:hypothetical protein
MRRSLFMHDGVTTRGAAAAPAGVAADFEQLLRHDGATNHFSNCERRLCRGSPWQSLGSLIRSILGYSNVF